MKRAYGFTIVELLIVIVVIGILAAISVVAYTNISQKANNSAIISTANSTVKLLRAYVVEHGTYPLTYGTNTRACLTIQSGCIDNGGTSFGANASLEAELAKTGSLPSKVPSSGSIMRGIGYQYTSTWTVDGVSSPAGIFYWLDGTYQDCGLSGILASTGVDTTFSTTGYTAANQGGKTRCVVTIPGPVHS